MHTNAIISAIPARILSSILGHIDIHIALSSQNVNIFRMLNAGVSAGRDAGALVGQGGEQKSKGTC